MEKRLLLNGIALHSADVAPGNVQLTSFVVPDFAHSRLALRYRAAVTAGETADAFTVQFFDQFRSGFADAFVNDLAQSRHTAVSILAPNEERRSQVSGLRSQVSGLRSQLNLDAGDRSSAQMCVGSPLVLAQPVVDLLLGLRDLEMRHART